jgi:predicted ATP-grasp superfamily ATP-dependent carboligase
MIKFSKNVDIKGSQLLLSFTSVGLAGNFASSLLINNNKFENIGFLFSHYLSAYVGLNPQTGTALYNGQVYFNEEKKIVLINFHAGVAHHFRNDFCKELLDIYTSNSLTGIMIYGGIGRGFLNDEELRNPNVDVYYLTNDSQFDGTQYFLKNFENLVQLENKKKAFEEVKYLDKVGLAKHLIKFFNKKKVTFHYLFAFSSELFDPLAGLAVYYKLSLLLGLSKENNVIAKNVGNLNSFMNKVESQFKVEPTWRLFLKE